MTELSTLSVGALKRLAVEHRISLHGCVEKGDIVEKLKAAGVAGGTGAAAAQQGTSSSSRGKIPREHYDVLVSLPRDQLVSLAKQVKVGGLVRDGMGASALVDLIAAAPGGIAAAALQVAAARQQQPPAPAPIPTPAPTPPSAPVHNDLSSMSVKQLRATAAARGVDVSNCLEKSEMVAALQAQVPSPAMGAASRRGRRRSSSSSSSSSTTSSAERARKRRKTAAATAGGGAPQLAPSLAPSLRTAAAVNVPLNSTQAMRGTPPPPTELIESDTGSEASSDGGSTPDPRTRGPAFFNTLEYTSRSARDVLPCQNRRGRESKVQPCKGVQAYKQLYLISEGTHGKVWKAFDREARKFKALKQFKYDDPNGFPETALKEIEKLQTLTHPNIVAMEDVVVGGHVDSIFLVLEYADRDLANLSHMKVQWTPKQIQRLVLDLALAVEHMHLHCIIHRDIKEANLLYTRHGVLKLCDFGCARSVGRRDVLTPDLVTLWYRAPEVLLGMDYSFPADIWSIGAVLGNIIRGDVLMRGECSVSQLSATFRVLGVPGFDAFPAFHEHFQGMTPTASRIDAEIALGGVVAGDAAAAVKDVLSALLAWDPSARPAAAGVVKHAYFSDPILHRDMPKFEASDVHLQRERRRVRRERNERAAQGSHSPQH